MNKEEFTKFIRKIILHNNSLRYIDIFDENYGYYARLTIKKLDYSLSDLIKVIYAFKLNISDNFRLNFCDENMEIYLEKDE